MCQEKSSEKFCLQIEITVFIFYDKFVFQTTVFINKTKVKIKISVVNWIYYLNVLKG